VRFRPGTTVVLREVLEGRVRSARPLRVVADEPEQFVGYLVPRSEVAWPRLADRVTQSQTPDQGWQLPLEEWHGPGALFVMPAGSGFAAVLFLDRDTHAPIGWKVDFFRPPVRHRLGFDTLDHAFDLLADAELTSWQTKDLDDLAQLVRLGLLEGPERRAFERERDRVERWLTERTGSGPAMTSPARAPDPGPDPAGPFTEGWQAWRPEPGWPPLELPAGWDDLVTHSAAPGPRRGVTGPGWRSARGIRLLDGNGAVHLDLDLAGGRLWLGHAHPALVEAIGRQLALGWHLGRRHPALDALDRALAAVSAPGWETAWTDRVHGADLDELLLDGWPSEGARLVPGTFGPRLFGGFDRYLWVGPADTRARLAPAGAAGAPDLLAIVAALETIRSADAATVAQATERATRIRRRCGLGGTGLALVGPAGWSAPGVVVPADGRGLLALCADEHDEAELIERLSRWQR